MERILSSLAVLIEFFLFVALGFAGKKLKFFDNKVLDGAVELLMKVAVPGAILSSASAIEVNAQTVQNACMLVLIYTLGFAVCIAGANAVSRLSFIPKEERPYVVGTITFKNISFMGFPLCISVLGKGSLFYAALCMVVFNLLHWSYGISLYSGEGKLRIKSVLANTSMVSIFLMLVLVAFRVQLPEIVWDTLGIAGNMCTPLSLLAVGMMLADVQFKKMLTDPVMYLVSVCTLVLFPIVTLGLVSLLRPADEVAAILLLLSVTPSATMNAVMAKRYGSAGEFVSLMVLQTMLLCLVTIPAITVLLFHQYL